MFQKTKLVTELNVTNSKFSADRCGIAEAYYMGGDDYFNMAVKKSQLYSRTADKNPAYMRSRLDVAEYTNNVAGLFDGVTLMIFQKEPKILFRCKDASKLKYYNSLNCGLSDTLMNISTDIQVHGYGILSLSFPDAKGPAESLGAQLAQGDLDGALTTISPSLIWDWNIDLLGNLQWIKSVNVEDKRETDYGESKEELWTWTYINGTTKAVYTASKKKREEWKKDAFGTLRSNTEFSSGLPLFEAALRNRTCLFERIKPCARSLFNAAADYAWAKRMQAYGQPWYSGKQTPAQLAALAASEMNLWHLGENGAIGYATPDATAFEYLRSSITEKRQELYTTTNNEFKATIMADQHAASGAAKEQDKNSSEAFARVASNRMRYCLSQAIDYIIGLRKDTGDVEYSIIGMEGEFDGTILTDRIANVTAFTALPASETAKRVALTDLSQQMAVNATPEERERIAQEMQDKEDDDLNQALAGAVPGATSTAAASSAATSASTGTSSGTSSGTTDGPAAGSTSSALLSTADPKGVPGDATVKAPKRMVNPKNIIATHAVDKAAMKELSAAISANGFDSDKGPLLAELPGGKMLLALDGHHRSFGAKDAGLKSIPAYVVPQDEFQKLLLARFQGSMPSKLRELDQYIQIKAGGAWKAYDKREQNDHAKGTNGSQSGS